jgi:hypothetical protein
MNDPPFTLFGGVCLVGAVSAAYSPISVPGSVRFTRKKGRANGHAEHSGLQRLVNVQLVRYGASSIGQLKSKSL